MSLHNEIKKIALKAVNAESPLKLVSATVVSAPPNLSIRLKENNKLTIPKELILVAGHLSRHRTEILVDGERYTVEFNHELRSGERVMVAVIQGGQSFFILDRIRTY